MGWAEDIDNIIAAEKITFIAYYIGVYESIQKFIGLITDAVSTKKHHLTIGSDITFVLLSVTNC
jgi:hypothetical protein